MASGAIAIYIGGLQRVLAVIGAVVLVSPFFL
jgi:hypothetical protein